MGELISAFIPGIQETEYQADGDIKKVNKVKGGAVMAVVLLFVLGITAGMFI